MPLLDITAAAERLGTSHRHVRELIYRRELPYYKIGRLVRIDAEDLDRWLDERRQPARRGAA